MATVTKIKSKKGDFVNLDSGNTPLVTIVKKLNEVITELNKKKNK